jgi:CTD small phosphatase-like protein 2
MIRPSHPISTVKNNKYNKDKEIFKNTYNGSLKNEKNEQNLTEEQQQLLTEFRNKINPENNPFNVNNTINIMAMTQDNRIPLNVEDLLIQEDKLFKILDNIRIKVNFNFSAEEYLEFSHINSIQNFDVFYSDPKMKSVITIAQIFEYISAILGVFLYLKNILTVQSVDHLRNILYYTHINLLMTISSLLKKISKEYENNIWVIKLRDIVNKKKSKFINGDENFVIEQNNNILFNSIGNFILTFFNNKNDFQTFSIINDILCNLSTCNLDNVKNNLSNLKNMMIYASENSNNSFVHINLPGPFLPKIDKKYEYTLVLDLDETIIHCLDQQEITPLIRPGTEEFLRELSPYYEIVIFTASVREYADEILDMIDKEKKWIQHRLYREHTTVINRVNVKDIKKLGRDLKKVIIIDNISENFGKESDNGIFITPWFGDKNDKELKYLIPILIEISKNKVEDVRKVLRNVRDVIMRKHLNGDEMPIQDIYNKLIEKNNTK